MAIPAPLPRIAEFEKFGMGMFIHWGLYSQLGRGEWVMFQEKIPKQEYMKLADTFTAEYFDSRAIAALAKRAGMKYITITTRHHDGFSLYDTKGLSVFDAPHSAAGRDLIREFVDGCRAEGIVPFFYHTTLDWNREEFETDFPSYLQYLRDSVEILCTNYGKIGGLWFDGNWSRKGADWEEDRLYAVIRKHQPDCVIINNTGTEARGKTGDREIDSVTFEQGRPEPMNRDGMEKYLAAEMCNTMNLHWGYAENDLNYQSLPALIENLCACRKVGANYLLNIGPDGKGDVPLMQRALLEGLGSWVRTCGDPAVYEGKPTEIRAREKDFALRSGGKYWFFIHGQPEGHESFAGIDGKIKSLRWVDDGKEIPFGQNGNVLNAEFDGYGYGKNLVVRVAEGSEEPEAEDLKIRMPRGRLLVGTYILQPYAQTEEHIRELKECGIDFVTCLVPKDRRVLDLFERHGLGCVISGVLPGWWGGDGENAGKMAEKNPLEAYKKAAERFEDHPAIWGVDIGDEPSALDFEHYGRVAELAGRLFPGILPYLNLYPNYAFTAINSDGQITGQLGTETYGEHIRQYVENVALPYISYDFYVYSLPREIAVGKMLDNFRIVSDVCRETGRDFWYVPQVNSVEKDVFTSENRLRYQAFAALCHGATTVNWACWTAGWWENNVLDGNGVKTEQYEKLKKVNAELKALSPVYMGYRNAGTCLVGFENEPSLECFPELKAEKSVDAGPLRGLCSDGDLIVGCMTAKYDGCKTAYMVLNASDPYDENPGANRVCFSTRGKIAVYGGQGEIPVARNGENCSFELGTCRGAIITAE